MWFDGIPFRWAVDAEKPLLVDDRV